MDDICQKFGINVKKFREQKGFSQEKLAEESELHRTYISAVERGVRSISLNNIQKISKALDIDIHKLFMFGDDDTHEKLD
jgi:transcriptional regulator with XRE-family HTH domain